MSYLARFSPNFVLFCFCFIWTSVMPVRLSSMLAVRARLPSMGWEGPKVFEDVRTHFVRLLGSRESRDAI